MAAADEFKRRQRVISHMFIDFLEALVRLADKVNLPTLKELQEWMKSNTKEDEEEFTTPTNPFWMYCKKTTTMVSAHGLCVICCHSSSCAEKSDYLFQLLINYPKCAPMPCDHCIRVHIYTHDIIVYKNVVVPRVQSLFHAALSRRNYRLMRS